MTQRHAKLYNGPFDGQIRSLPVDTTLDADKEERGNPQLVISYRRIVGGEKEMQGMYLRRHKPNADGTWEYLWVEREDEIGVMAVKRCSKNSWKRPT